MLARYDAAISQYATQKSEAVDAVISTGYESAKEKAKSIKADDVRNFIDSIKAGKEEENPPQE